ncbi:hypothetical protein GQ607_012074 [Colletotrichum asianum]|uniref:Zn(2)-C6 fungal-type domain-containing protein n=1 Tax=Colletotrichum asianum TaxID=702518 RepID=A0A8H3ZM76_9PEZI|nr:hypothetical protein GQ607_012074 [Colletotrichum asianum]
MPMVTPSSPNTRRRNGRPHACGPCHRRKVACDRARPVCSSCRRRRRPGEPCEYETEDSEPPVSTTRQRIRRRTRSASPPTSPEIQTRRRSITGARDRSEQERNSPDVNSPVDTQSPGFLGFTSYLGIYEETRDALSPFQPQLTSKARRSGINTPNTEPEHKRVSDAVLKTCVSVLQSIPRREDAQVLFGSHFNECDIAFQLIAPRALDRFYHHYGRLFETMDHNAAKLSDLAETICMNTSKVFMEDEPDGNRYIDQFSGENTRWETLGLLFAYWFLGSRGVKNTPKTVKSAAVLRKCLNDCVLLARATASKAGNTLSVYLHYKRGIVDSVADGDASLSCWQSHGECVTLLTSLGLHIDDSAPNQPYMPTLASELRRRLFGHVFHSDKAGSTFTGRPPVLCGKFTSTPLPLALRDEDLLADETTRKAAAEALDIHGWNRDGALPPVGNLRARVCFSMIRDDIFEIALAVRPVVVPALQTLMGIKERQLQAYAQLPSAMRLNTAEVKKSTLNDGTLYTLLVVHLEHLQNLFFVEQLLFRGGHTNNDDLLRVSFEMVSTAVMFWTNMDRFTPLHWDFMWLVMAYAAPGGGVLCLELLRPTPTGDPQHPKPSRSNIIQQLSLLVGFLSWVKPSAPNADLCADCKVVIQHVLDHALNDTGAVGNALPVDISSWDVSAQLDFNFDLMDTFDWLRPDFT